MMKYLWALVLAAGLSLGLGGVAFAGESPTTHVERDRFTVEVTGNGPDVILIPGLASPRSVWDATKAQLQGRYRLHLVQIRGFGDAPGANATGEVLVPFVEELAAYIRDEGLNKPAIIGHSMGGLSAAMIAARYPDLPGKVLIEDSLPFIGLIFSPAATVELVKPQADAILSASLAAGQQPGDPRTLATMSATEAGRAQVAAWGDSADYRVVAQVFHDVLLTDIRPQLPNITAPVTMLYPYDAEIGPIALVDALYKNAYAGLAGVQLVRIDNSRHFITLDQPEAFATAVEAFLTH